MMMIITIISLASCFYLFQCVFLLHDLFYFEFISVKLILSISSSYIIFFIYVLGFVSVSVYDFFLFDNAQEWKYTLMRSRYTLYLNHGSLTTYTLYSCFTICPSHREMCYHNKKRANMHLYVCR